MKKKVITMKKFRMKRKKDEWVKNAEENNIRNLK